MFWSVSWAISWVVLIWQEALPTLLCSQLSAFCCQTDIRARPTLTHAAPLPVSSRRSSLAYSARRAVQKSWPPRCADVCYYVMFYPCR